MYPFVFLLAAQLGPIAPDVPARQPQMTVAGASVALTFGAGDAVYFSASRDLAKTVSAPVRVAQAGSLMLGRHRGPRIAAAGDAIVITAVMGKAGSGGFHMPGASADGDLVSWSSHDGGKTWSGGAVVNDVAGASNEGLHALASDGRSRLFAAWLDKRGAHGTKLYGALSTNGGASWSRNVLIYESPDGTICECCHPSVAFDLQGHIVVMWRNSLAGARDLYLARSADGIAFSKAEKLGAGAWKLNACPMDGGGIAISGDRIVTAWRREHDLFLDSPGLPETHIGSGSDIAIAGDSHGVYAIWSTPAGIQASIPGRPTITLSPKGAFPSIVVLPGMHPIAAWEEGGGIAVQPIP